MLPRRIIFATNVSRYSGAGHIRRLVEISRAFPSYIEKYFYGSIEINWVKEMTDRTFLTLHSLPVFGQDDLVILDTYEKEFSLKVSLEFLDSRIIQIADRYTFLLPNTSIIFMDLPFTHQDPKIESRVIAHGIEYLPIRSFSKHTTASIEKAKSAFVTTGGSVNERVFTQLVEELAKDKYEDVSFQFIGRHISVKSHSPNLFFHELGSDFDAIVGSCDTAISAAGTTMWDLFANSKLVGLTALVYNQSANLDYAIRSGQALEVFDPTTLNLDVTALHSLLFDSSVRKSLYRSISGKYDFGGAKRVVEVVLKSY